MRQPTHDDWHARALAHVTRHGSMLRSPEMPPVHEDEPHPGWYKRRVVSRGPWVPASISLEAPIDPETGELLGDEYLVCEVAGEPRDVMAEWTYLCGNPISREAYTVMLELMFTGELA